MPPRTTTKRPSASLRQSSLSFASKRSTAAGAGSKGSFLKSLSTTPIASAPRTPEPRTADDLDVIEVFDDAEPFVEEIDISDSDEEYAPTASKRGGAGRKGKKTEDIDDSEEPPKKKRRTSARKATVQDAVEPADDSDVPVPKGKGKGKGKQRAAAKKSLKHSVFRSREGVENSDREGGNATPDWKIAVKGSQDTPGHVNREELLRHFGEVRERMGNVKPIHADKQTMEDHILRVFDLSYEYGPCIGVTRLQRWTRADALGLNPPSVVKQLLTNEDGSEKDDVKQCVFFGEV